VEKLKQEATGFICAYTIQWPLPAGGNSWLSNLLIGTGCWLLPAARIYFEDYPGTAHLECPEWSHLTPSDAIIYTKNLIRILQQEKRGI
jgi:hypothetical protein